MEVKKKNSISFQKNAQQWCIVIENFSARLSSFFRMRNERKLFGCYWVCISHFIQSCSTSITSKKLLFYYFKQIVNVQSN